MNEPIVGGLNNYTDRRINAEAKRSRMKERAKYYKLVQTLKLPIEIDELLSVYDEYAIDEGRDRLKCLKGFLWVTLRRKVD